MAAVFFLLFDCIQAPLHCLSNVRHPAVSILLGVGVDLVHFRLIGGSADEEHGFLLMGHLPDNQLLKRDHRRLVVLGSQEKDDGKEEEKKKSDCRFFTVTARLLRPFCRAHAGCAGESRE